MTGTPSFDGEAVEIGGGSNHIVAYNSITRVADGVSPGASNAAGATNIDIYGNDIFNVTDDGIELDGSGANTRVWGNRIHNAGHNGFSFQPQSAAPWYIIRNQVVNAAESIFKFRQWDRYVIYHNTFVNWSFVLGYQSDGILSAISGTISSSPRTAGQSGSRAAGQRETGGRIWITTGSTGAAVSAFNYGGNSASTIANLTSASGQESHGVRISRQTCFATFNVPGGPPQTTIPPQMMTLEPGCPAVDAGVILPNISDGYAGAHPI